MLCIIALVVFAILGIFSATHRELAWEALDCVTRRVTLRPCTSGFKEKVKSKVLAVLLNRSVFAARVFNRHFELVSWVFIILIILSTVYVVKGAYNFYFYASCNGLNQSGFCAFDPSGEHNKVTELSSTCGIVPKEESNLTLEGVEVSLFPSIPGTSDDTVVFIGCYDCEFTRKAYPSIQKLVKKHSSRYVFAHFPAKEHTKFLSEIGHCVYKEYGDRFWAFNDRLFTGDRAYVHDRNALDALLTEFGFDIGTISTCTEKPETKREVEQQLVELKKTNLYGTPTVFVNGTAFVGPKPYRVYSWEFTKWW